MHTSEIPTSSSLVAATSNPAPAERSDRKLFVKYSGHVREPYSVSADGHYIGEDGFVVPRSYAEFREQFPTHVRNFVDRHMFGYSQADCEDCTSELDIYLMTMPRVSKFREAGCNGFPDGCADRIQMFDPEKANGASKARFLSFINRLLTNCFISLRKQQYNNPVGRNSTLAITLQDDANGPGIISNEFLHLLSSSAYRQGQEVQRQMERHAEVSRIRSFVGRHNPELLPVLDALAITETFIEAQKMLGMNDQLFTRARNRLRTLTASFLQRQIPPRQRKVYRPRETKGTTGPSLQPQLPEAEGILTL